MRLTTRAFVLAAIVWNASAFVRGQAPIFRASVAAILVPVSVTNGNRPVTGLTTSDFELLDGGVVQDVAAATVESVPTDVTLVLDTSASVKGRALARFIADIQTIAESLRPNDRVRLITFATDIHDAFGLQPGGTRLPIERITAGGGTSFYNALAAALIAFPQSDRPQLIFGFSDGLDTVSFLDARTIASLASYSGAALYLALTSPDPVTGSFIPAMAMFNSKPNLDLLRQAAARTGGAVYEKSAGSALADTFRQVLDDFRASYVLTYTPHGVTSAGWHDLTVRVTNQHYTIRARKGYDGT